MPAFNGPREVHGDELIYDWIAAPHTSEQIEALLQWFKFVCRDPDDLITGEIIGITRPGRRAFYSDVPIAETRATFVLREHPVPTIWLVDIDDGAYQLS